MYKNIKTIGVLLSLLILSACKNDHNFAVEDEATYPSTVTPPMITTSESPKIPYAGIFSAVSTIGGLGYAVYKNDGKVTRGLVMRVVNPQGYLVQEQDKQTEMLKEMRDALDDIIANLDLINQELDSIVTQMKKNHDELLNLIATPFDARSQIKSAEQDFIAYTSNTQPNEANEQKIKDLYNLIVDTYNVWGNINNIQDKITENGAQIFYTHTSNLIDSIGSIDSLKKDELNKAYNSLEHYTYYWINTMTRGINLVVEAYKAKVKEYDEDSIAKQKYEWFLEYIDSDLNDADVEYSFIYNVWRLIINYTDPYYDHPDHDRKFLPKDTYKILKRAEFFKRVLSQKKNLGLIHYDIRTMQDNAGSVYAYSSTDNTSIECSKDVYKRDGASYDMWDGNELSYDNTYQIAVYNCPVEIGTYTLKNSDGEIIKDNIIVEKYNYNMESNPEGELTYGFNLSSSRHSAQLENLNWKISNNYKGIEAKYTITINTSHGPFDSIKYTYPSDSYAFKTTKSLTYPLNLKMIFDDDNGKYNQSHFDKKPYHFFNDKLSIYKEFVYSGNRNHTFKLDTKFNRYYHVDTSGNAKTVHKMYLYDVTESKTKTEVFGGFNDLKSVDNDDIKHTYDEAVSKSLYLKADHKYRLYIHMAALGEQKRWFEGCYGTQCSSSGYEFYKNIVIKQEQLRKMRLFY